MSFFVQNIVFLSIHTLMISAELIGPAPLQGMIRDEDHTLYCEMLESQEPVRVQFVEETDTFLTVIFDGPTRISDLPKYNNFGMETNSSSYWHVTISDVELEDEGTYGCYAFETGETNFGDYIVEVPADKLAIVFPEEVESGPAITLVDGNTYVIWCMSVKTRPSVEIRWYDQAVHDISENELTDHYQQVDRNENDDACFDTTSTLHYYANKMFNGGRLRCLSTGQLAVSNKDDIVGLNILYKPYVTLKYDNKLITCSADANPDPSYEDYLIVLNNDYENTYVGPTLQVHIIAKTDIECFVSHEVAGGHAMITVEPSGGSAVHMASFSAAVVAAAVFIAITLS